VHVQYAVVRRDEAWRLFRDHLELASFSEPSRAVALAEGAAALLTSLGRTVELVVEDSLGGLHVQLLRPQSCWPEALQLLICSMFPANDLPRRARTVMSGRRVDGVWCVCLNGHGVGPFLCSEDALQFASRVSAAMTSAGYPTRLARRSFLRNDPELTGGDTPVLSSATA
jgi:hypothetical protein